VGSIFYLGRVPQAVLLKADSLLKPANTTDFPAVAMNWPENGSCVAQNRIPLVEMLFTRNADYVFHPFGRVGENDGPT